MEYVVIRKREKKRGSGLAFQRKYIVKGPKYMMVNIKYMIKDYLGQTNC